MDDGNAPGRLRKQHAATFIEHICLQQPEHHHCCEQSCERQCQQIQMPPMPAGAPVRMQVQSDKSHQKISTNTKFIGADSFFQPQSYSGLSLHHTQAPSSNFDHSAEPAPLSQSLGSASRPNPSALPPQASVADAKKKP